MLGISWPTYGLYFFIFFAFIPLISLLDNYRKQNNLTLTIFSFVTFFTWNLITTYWLYYASFFGMLFAVIVNSALMSFVVFISLIFHKKLGDRLSVIFFITLWICFEKFHLNWDFSWPWLNLGNVFSENTNIIQWYEYTGAFGGTLWVLCSNFTAYMCVKKIQAMKSFKSEILTLTFIIFLPIFCSLLIYQNITIEEISAKEHDMMAARSQGLTHFVGRVIDDFGTNETRIDTEGYKALHKLVSQTCNDTWELFEDIQNFNPYTEKMISELNGSFKKISEIIEK